MQKSPFFLVDAAFPCETNGKGSIEITAWKDARLRRLSWDVPKLRLLELFVPGREPGSGIIILLMEEIRRSPVVGGSLSPSFIGFYTSQVVGLGISEPSTVGRDQ